MEEHGAEEGGKLDVTLAGAGCFVDGSVLVGMCATDTRKLSIETLFVGCIE